jgi:tetratricopeptide (TPR) repeat protein
MITPSSFAEIQTLLIDDMQTQRTTLRGQLTQLGITKVDQVASADEAIKIAQSKPYDLVMCDFNLNQKTDGQQLLEFMRDNNLLLPSCLFFMVTAENSYLSVASASEHRPDAYLLKPITAGDVGDRLKTLLERRRALEPINYYLDRKEWAGVIYECDSMIDRRSRWTMQALQIKAQTLLQMGRHQDAAVAFKQALSVRDNLVWAQIGLAKALKAAGELEQAKAMAQTIIHTKDGEKNIEAYDLVAACLEEQGDTEGAFEVMKNSAAVMPSARRQRMVAESAYLNGDLETAKECFARLAKATRGAITSLPQDILGQAQMLVDTGEAKEATKLLDDGLKQYRNDADFAQVALAIRAQAQAQQGDMATAAATLTKARQSLKRNKADFAAVALAKAEIMAGNEEAGIKMMADAVSSDHENIRIKKLIGNALRQTGHEDKVSQVVDGAVEEINKRVDSAKVLFRSSKMDEALQAIEEALKQYPENTGVLLQAAQMNCLALRMKKTMNTTISDRVRKYLRKLDTLLPNNDRVAKMNLYYRDTLAQLQQAQASKV